MMSLPHVGLAASVVTTIVLVVGIGLIKLEGPSRDAAYVGSEVCANCHRSEHQVWHASLHRKMMRPVDEDGALIVDLESGETPASFGRDDIVWVIGSKWEQQFMGHDGDGETLLPGVFRRLTEDFDTASFDGWQVPVPLRRCHGCHTVGLDTETGTFVEAGIGCESCHGPGGRHAATFGLAALHSSADPQLCGQCHVRGKSPDGRHYFPTDFRPGDALLDKIVELRAMPEQNTTQWWGNGYERSRHQQFTAWRESPHARSLDTLREDYDGRFGAVDESCMGCHSGDYILASTRGKPSVESAEYGITCAVCHQTHGELETARAQCADCHTDGPYHHEASATAATKPHVVCSEEARVDCVACHMPQVVKSGGGYPMHSHKGGIVPPSDGPKFGMPTSCSNAGCHVGRDAAWLDAAFVSHYGRAGGAGTVRERAGAMSSLALPENSDLQVTPARSIRPN